MNGSRVIVLDDDPTGTQCAGGVDVLLRPDPEVLAERLGRTDDPLFVLTNSRALERSDAADLVAALVAAPHEPVTWVLRGDSTLRGHVFAEMTALGLDAAAGLFVPAFPAGGRVTLDGVHLLTGSGVAVNVADTEYAADPVFGFSARTMRDWVAEVGGQRPVRLLRSADLRQRGAAAVSDALLACPDGGVVVPDAESDADIAAIAEGFRRARGLGRAVVLRCAAPLAAAVADRLGTVVAAPAAHRVLVVCGSHTAGATRQLERLTGRAHVVSTAAARAGGSSADVARVIAGARADLDAGGCAVVSTERERNAGHNTQADGAAVMDALIGAVSALLPQVDAVVTKGGITGAEVAARAADATWARVMGRLEDGIALWQVSTGWGSTLPMAVVPGNIGDDDALLRTLERFRVGTPVGG